MFRRRRISSLGDRGLVGVLAFVVGHVPAGTFELNAGGGNLAFRFAFTFRALLSFRRGKTFDLFVFISAFHALVFV
jgi:hypothetical protein